MSHALKRHKNHHYGEIYLSESARALLGDQYIRNVYNLASDTENPQQKQREIMSALAYMDMNLRRNQLEARKVQHVEWIWGPASPLTTMPRPANDIKGYERRKYNREHLSRAWGFDADDDDIWSAIRNGIDSDALDEMTSASDPGFVQWLQTNEPVFWINGKPASGKSSLMVYLSDHEKSRMILDQRSDGKWHLLHFFFDFRAGGGISNSLEGMFRSLLFQLMDQIPQIAAHISSNPSTANLDIKHNSLSTRTMTKLIQSCVSAVDTHLCIFLDGLDEYQGSYTDLVDVLLSLADGLRIKLCLASRPEPEISHVLGEFPSLKMQLYNHDTIANYARSTFDRATQIDMPPGDVWKLVGRIVAESYGVILWSTLVCTEMKQGLYALDSTEELLAKITEYPHDLDQVYSRLLSKVGNYYLAEALVILFLLETYPDDNKFAGSPELTELCHICETVRDCGILPAYPKKCLTPEIFAARLLSRFGGLIDIVPLSNTPKPSYSVRLTHKTLSSFLHASNYMDHPVMKDLRARFPNRVWLRLFCDYILLPKHLPLATELGIDSLGKNKQIDLSKFSAALQISGIEMQNRQNLDSSLSGLSPELQDQYKILTHVVGYMINRARVSEDINIDEDSLRSSETYELVRKALLTSPVRFHTLNIDGKCCPISYDFALNASQHDYALSVCVYHNLWLHAKDLLRFSTRDKALRAEAGYELADYSHLPRTLRLLDELIDQIHEAVELTRLFSHMLKSYAHRYVGPIVQRLAAFRMLTGQRNDMRVLPSDLIHRHYWVYHLDKGKELASFTEFWTSIFQAPFPTWCESFGITRFFLLAVYYALAYYFHSSCSEVLEWVDLFLTAGDSLNAFCYPGGSILHLIVESLPLLKSYTVDIVESLIQRNINVLLEGPHGTALDIIKNFPHSRNCIFKLKPEFTKEARNFYFGSQDSVHYFVEKDTEDGEVAAALCDLLTGASTRYKAGRRNTYEPPSPEHWLRSTAEMLYDENGKRKL